MSEAITATPSARRQKLQRQAAAARAGVEMNWHKVTSHAVVITDADGRVTDCNGAAAKLLNRQPEKLPGENLSTLLPGLPFARETPGYNLAYAGFHAGAERWLSGTAHMNDGSRIAVDISFRTAKRNHQRFIMLTLRPSAESPSGHAR